MAKRKILVAVTNDISTDVRVDKVCNYLIDKGYDVITYGRVLKNTISVTKNYKIIRIKHFFNHNFMFYAEYNIRLFFFLIFKNFDVILSNDLDTLPATFFASKVKNSKLVYDSHELFSEGPELQGRLFVQRFWRNLENYFLPKIKNSYTVSQSISDFYNKKYDNNMGVIRNLPLLHRENIKKEVSFPTDNKVILYQGVLNPGRGIRSTIRAMKYLEDVDFVIIGYGKVEDELKNFVKNENMENRVHFLGRINYNILQNYTRKADVGIVLEESLGLSFEFSLPNKLFDYIHAELPFVTGNLTEISKIVREYKVGEIVKEQTPENIAKSILELLNNSEKRNSIIKSQQIAKNDLCWEKEQQKLAQYF